MCSASKLLTAISSKPQTVPKTESSSSSSSSPKSTASKIFSAVPFSSVDDGDDEDEDELGDSFPSASSLTLPQSLKTAMGALFYLLEDTLQALSGNIEADTQLTAELIEK